MRVNLIFHAMKVKFIELKWLVPREKGLLSPKKPQRGSTLQNLKTSKTKLGNVASQSPKKQNKRSSIKNSQYLIRTSDQ